MTRARRAAALLLVAFLSGPLLAGRAGEVRKQAFDLLNEGVAAYQRGDYALAVDELRQSCALSLNSFRGHYHLGLALFASRRYTEALEAFDLAIELDPRHVQVLVARGDTHLRNGELDAARADDYRALRVRPAYAPALDGLARCDEAEGKTEAAIDHYRQALRSDRGYAPAMTHLGDLYLRVGRVEEAVRMLEEAVSVRPDLAAGHDRLAAAYGRIGLRNEAAVAIGRAIELAPGAPEPLETLGWLQLDAGIPGAAEDSFRRALSIDAALPGSQLGLAEVARRRGDYDGALAAADRALAAARPGGVEATRAAAARAEIAAEAERVKGLEGRLAAGSATPEDHAALAALSAARGEWSRAVELGRQAPATPDNAERLAYYLLSAGRYREAHEAYARLDSPRARFNDGVALALLGSDAEAERAFAALAAEHPDDRRAALYLANARLRLGRTREAAQGYRGFLDAGGSDDPDAERVRRILRQIAPDLLPPPPAPPGSER